MPSHVIQAAFDAGLSPLASRVAVIVADLAGSERALRFIDCCTLENEARGIEGLSVGTVLKAGLTSSIEATLMR